MSAGEAHASTPVSAPKRATPVFEERLDTLLRVSANDTYLWSTRSVFAILGGFVLVGFGASIATADTTVWLRLWLPVSILAVVALGTARARRGPVARSWHFGLILLAATLPSLHIAVLSIADPSTPAAYVHSPDSWFWVLVIVASGLLLERDLARLVGIWCGVQYLALFFIARPALTSMTGPESVLGALTAADFAIIKSLMLVLLGFMVGHQVGQIRSITRRMFARLSEEEVRTLETEHARVAAVRASEAKSDFLVHMNHEIRTPLNAILGYAQILARRTYIDREHRAGLDVIRQSGEHLRELIDDLLEMSRIESGTVELEPRPVHLPGLVVHIGRLMDVRARAKGIELVVDIADEVPRWGHVDPKRLRQVLLNLIGNAIKFTDAGRVVLTVEVVDMRAHAEAPTLRFSVCDTGIGVPADALEAIFQPFQQACDRERRSRGLGLGLAISDRLVRLMGGRLQVDSEAGQGSRFWFDAPIPLANEDATATLAVPITGHAGPQRRILVVDDQPLNRMVLLEMLTPLGFDVELAKSGHEALDALAGQPFDLVLLDIVMPGLDGVEVARRIRTMDDHAGIPIVAVTANPSAVAGSQESAMEPLPFDDHLVKPVTLDILLRKLEHHLDLTWTHETSVPPLAAADGPEEDGDLSQPPQPPAETLESLLEYALVGNMTGLGDELATLAQGAPPYQSFIRHLASLTRDLEDEAIIETLQQALRSDASAVDGSSR